MMKQRILALAVAALIGVAASVPASAQVRLIFASQSNPASTVGQFFGAWAKHVSDASQGTGVVEIREGGTLANFQNVYERVLDDVVQIGFGQQALIAGKFPLTEVVVLPFIVKDNTVGSVALWRLYKTGLLDNEYDQVVPIWMNLLGPSYLHFNKVPPTLNDLSGLKIRVTGRVNSEMVKRLGGAPVSLPAENMYDGLQRGSIDGLITSWSAFAPYHLAEVSSYHVLAPLGVAPAMFFMSKKKYESLPPQLRAALEANGDEAQSRFSGEAWRQDGLSMQASLAASGKHTIKDLPPETLAAWEARTEPLIKDWAAGVPGGEKVLATYRQLYADVEAGR
jgi:TRAP-type C4-dicarboxylate transport system substrate-binding protein